MVSSSEEKVGEKEKLEKECPACGETTVVRDYQQNIEICENCGRIVKEGIKDRGPEWRAFDQEQEENRSRGGPPTTQTIHDKGLSTQIDYKNRDARGNKLSPERSRKMHRLRKWHKRGKVSGAQDRNLAHAFSEMDRISSDLGIPKNVREIASKLYRRAVDEDLIRGRSIEGVSSAILYAACRKAEIPRTLEEVAEESRVDKKEISRSYQFIVRKLDIQVPLTDPASYVARFGSELGISGETKAEAMELVRKAKKERLTSGKSPSGTAAAAIYIAALKNAERRTQKEVAKTADVTEVTVRNRYKEIGEELDISINLWAKASKEGEVADKEVVALWSGESKTVEFPISKEKEGTYKVTVGEMSKSFEVKKVEKQVEFEVSNLNLSKEKIKKGETTTVSVKVTNTGGKKGTYTAELSIDGKVKTQSITLKPDESEKVTFQVSRERLAPMRSR